MPTLSMQTKEEQQQQHLDYDHYQESAKFEEHNPLLASTPSKNPIRKKKMLLEDPLQTEYGYFSTSNAILLIIIAVLGCLGVGVTWYRSSSSNGGAKQAIHSPSSSNSVTEDVTSSSSPLITDSPISPIISTPSDDMGLYTVEAVRPGILYYPEKGCISFSTEVYKYGTLPDSVVKKICVKTKGTSVTFDEGNKSYLESLHDINQI